MAAIISIDQGTDGLVNTTYKFVNTGIEDDDTLIKSVWVPLLMRKDELSRDQQLRMKKAFDRFFANGLFLYTGQFEMLNRLLSELGLPTCTLKNDGRYYQPVQSGKKSPSTASFKEHGANRYAKLEQAMEEAKNPPKAFIVEEPEDDLFARLFATD